MKIIKIGYLLIIIGSILLINKYVIKKNEIITEKNKIEYSLSKVVGYKTKEIKEEDLYDMILSIPQIKLKKGIYEKDNKKNDINETVMIHKSSNYPEQENSNLILIAHSGAGEKAFFNDLEKLNNDSLIEMYYKRVKYIYKLENKYKIEKNGTANIKRNPLKKTITLITCDQQDKSKQIVYIGYLIDEI